MAKVEHCFAVGDLIVTDLNAIPRPIKYIGATEVYVEDEHHPLDGEWLPVSFIEPYTVASGCKGSGDEGVDK